MENRKRVYLGAFVIVILFLVLTSSTALAAILNVGSTAKYKTIQSAINAAHNGDTIKVAKETYKENIRVADKKLTITGPSPDPSKYPSIYGADFCCGATGMLYGFLITKNDVNIHDGAGMTIQSNVFSNCKVDVVQQAGNVNITNNKFDNAQSGIYIIDSRKNSIEGNTFYKSKIGIMIDDRVVCQTITQNTFDRCQVGIQVETMSKQAPCYITRNKYSGTKTPINLVLPN